MGNKQRGKMKKRLLVAALAACMAFPASLPAQAAGTVHGKKVGWIQEKGQTYYCDPSCLLYTSPSPRDRSVSRMPSSA